MERRCPRCKGAFWHAIEPFKPPETPGMEGIKMMEQLCVECDRCGYRLAKFVSLSIKPSWGWKEFLAKEFPSSMR